MLKNLVKIIKGKNIKSQATKDILEDSEKREEEVIEKYAGRKAEACLYCRSKDIVKRGKRKKKYETVQLYLCKSCGRTFTSQIVKGKRYPLKLMLDSLSTYNLGYSLEETARLMRERFGIFAKPATISN